jgi:hypothetical protein
MTPNLGRYLNKTILVSIPSLFEDDRCRPYKLIGIELFGLWLEGGDLASRFLTHEYKSVSPATWAVFIPFSQIACVAIATASPTSAPSQPASRAQTPVAGGEPSSAASEGTREKPEVENG